MRNSAAPSRKISFCPRSTQPASIEGVQHEALAKEDVPADIGVVGAFDERPTAYQSRAYQAAPNAVTSVVVAIASRRTSPQIESRWIRNRRTLEPDAVHGRISNCVGATAQWDSISTRSSAPARSLVET